MSRRTAPARLKRGILVSTPLDGGKVIERELIQCCHCQFTAVWLPGMEKGWGVCWRCHDWHCARASCVKRCRHHRQWLHRMSAGKDPDAEVTTVRVDHEPPRSAGGVLLGS